MCLINYNKKERKYKHLTYAEKTMIERWHNKDKKSNKEIGKLLNKSERTIRREIKRGLTTNLTTYYEEIKVYSADISNDEYKANMKAKGQDLKIGSDRKTIELVEKLIKEEKKSPEVVAYELGKKEKKKRKTRPSQVTFS